MPAKSFEALLKDYEQYTSFGDEQRDRRYFRSGILALNYIVADNNGAGIPGGTLLQLLGEATHGKSTLALDFIAQAQKTDIREIVVPYKKQTRIINAAILDFEHSFDATYATLLGVDVSKLYVIRPSYAEEGFSVAEALLKEGLQILVVDSVGMLVSQSEEDKDYNDNEKIGSEAKVLGRFLKRANALADLSDSLVIVINHYRANLSPMARSDKKPYGARILQYAVKITIKVVRIGLKNGIAETEAQIEKTKLGPPGLRTTFNMAAGKGIDYAHHILTLAIEYGIVQKSGSWLTYGDQKVQGIEQGTEKFPIAEIEQKVIQVLSKGE